MLSLSEIREIRSDRSRLFLWPRPAQGILLGNAVAGGRAYL
ncbi:MULTISPECIES: hypothetical protein [unclassified Leptolyngbya]|nr:MULTISPECIES: hypothetical protein [unclassified Leptolyngbya]